MRKYSHELCIIWGDILVNYGSLHAFVTLIGWVKVSYILAPLDPIVMGFIMDIVLKAASSQ